ncbi:hypothetical protein [Methanococcoides sp. FTZ1]|uniref:hypothetical protein n=1 Tax=Methanococcoides sp. FTZ1 TaxID=3439061 RepID=UPI003F8791DD
MIANLPTNDVNNQEYDVDFDVEVLNYVYDNCFVRRRQLIDYLLELHKDKRGFKRPSIERKLQRLTKNGKLVIIKHPELEDYSIYEEDNRASYLSLPEIIDDNKYLDELFSHFELNGEYDKNSILNEIDLHQERYSFTRKQLDVLVDNLNTNDDKLLLHLIRILQHYIIDRGITPTKKEELLKFVNCLLGKFAGKSKTHEGYRRGLLFILGHYNDDSIIDWLKYDLNRLDVPANFDNIKEDYGNHYTARVINRHKLELFKLINDLKKAGKEEEARLVYNVKHEVAKLFGHIKEKEYDF